MNETNNWPWPQVLEIITNPHKAKLKQSKINRIGNFIFTNSLKIKPWDEKHGVPIEIKWTNKNKKIAINKFIKTLDEIRGLDEASYKEIIKQERKLFKHKEEIQK